MRRDFSFRISDVEKVLYEMDQRGQEYFEETMRLARIFDLLNKNRVQEEFEKRVVVDVPQRLETKVNELIDWLVENDLRQWQAVMDHVADRRRQHQEQIIGDDGSGSFHYDRQRLMDDVGKEAQSVVETYDRTREAEKIASGCTECRSSPGRGRSWCAKHWGFGHHPGYHIGG